MKTEIKFKQKLIPILLGLLIVLQIIAPYKGWLVLILTLAGLWSLSYYFIKSYTRHLKIIREMRYGWARVGDILEERIIIQNDGIVALSWMEIHNHSDMPNRIAAIGSSVSEHASTTWQIKQKCSRRGLFTIGPTTLRAGDPFGFYELSLHNPAKTQLLITPPIMPLPTIQVAGGGRSGDGRPAAHSHEKSVVVNTIRDYQPQDPLRHIHWPLSVKRGELTSKTFENTPTSDWWVVVDMQEAVQVGEGFKSSLEIGIILAASMIVRGLQEGVNVGLITNGKNLDWLPQKRGEAQRLAAMQILALSKPGQLSLDELLAKMNQIVHQPASLILITANTNPEWLKHLIDLKRRGIIPTVLLLDPLSFGAAKSQTVLTQLLLKLGISTNILSADSFDESQWEQEAQNTWEWRIMGTGRVIPIKRPKDLGWRVLR